VFHAVPLQVYAAGDITPVLQKMDVERARKDLHAYAAKIPDLRTTKHEEIVVCAPATDAISMLVEHKEIGLVVVGSSGRAGINKIVLGSVAEATVRRLHCPVLVVGPNCTLRNRSLKTMVLAADIPHSSLRPAQYAMSIARETGATLSVVHAFPKNSAEGDDPSLKKRATEELRQLAPPDMIRAKRLHIELVKGEPGEEIVNIADRTKAGLIVMGVHEQTPMADHAPRTMLSEVIRGAHCPVLAVQARLV
jgi:nucleotide-binding universal stress UspA family protein